MRRTQTASVNVEQRHPAMLGSGSEGCRSGSLVNQPPFRPFSPPPTPTTQLGAHTEPACSFVSPSHGWQRDGRLLLGRHDDLSAPNHPVALSPDRRRLPLILVGSRLFALSMYDAVTDTSLWCQIPISYGPGPIRHDASDSGTSPASPKRPGQL